MPDSTPPYHLCIKVDALEAERSYPPKGPVEPEERLLPLVS